MPRPPARRYGQGSIFAAGHYADGKPRYAGELYLGVDAAGKAQKRRVYGRTKSEVTAQLNALIAQAATDDLTPANRQTTGDYLDEWLATVKLRLRESTARSYDQMVRCHIRPAVGQIKLTALEPGHVDRMAQAMRTKGVAPRTIEYARAILRAALNRAIKRRILRHNAAALSDAITVPKPEIAPLTPQDAAHVLSVAKEDRLAALWTVALALGLRQGECLGLRWSDLDLDTRELHVRVQLQKGKAGWALLTPKNKAGVRSVRLPHFVVEALRAHKTRQQDEPASSWGLIFTTAAGGPLDRHNIYRQWRQLLDRARVDARRFHDLRHTCAAVLIANGLGPREIADVLGHSQITLTLNIYAHIFAEGKYAPADAMDKVFGPDSDQTPIERKKTSREP